MSMIEQVTATEAGLVVTIEGIDTTLSWRWVRDHGEDDSSFDPATKQRRIYALGADAPAAATTAALTETDGSATVTFTWPTQPDNCISDAAISDTAISDTAISDQTWISQATLLALMVPESAQSASTPAASLVWPWHEASQVSITTLDVAAVLSDDAALAEWVRDLAEYGCASLAGFTGGHDEVTALASRIGYPRSTIFGPTWDLASDLSDHEDTAYTQAFLAPHTDGTYSHEAPGLQMFCCLERTGTGGESVIVDAFAIAETLRSEYPEDFAVLTTVRVPGHYIEPGIELRTSRPAIRLDDTGAIVQISMNNYDRSPMLLPAAEMDAFYQAYGRLHDLANDRDRWLTIRLEPGDVLINDNWRVLHGRQAYTGARRFIGCYLSHEDFESRIRTLDLI